MTAGESTAVDFARSSVTWLLADPSSYGRFALDAILTMNTDTYVLGAQVFAGNVYSSGELFKDPPYGFSAAFSSARFRIFRDAARGEPLQDTGGTIDRAFREVKVDVVRRKCRPIAPEALAGRPFVANTGLTARIRIEHSTVCQPQELEFPVRHINVNAVTQAFQVETGPLLLESGSDAEGHGRLRRAFAMFNSLTSADFLVDADRPSTPGRNWNDRLRVPCEVSLFEMADPWIAIRPA